MIYITGDTHGSFYRFEYFCTEMHTSTEDVCIILGDAGLNYHGEERNFRGELQDELVKRKASQLPLTFFCIHGNHEMRPEDVPTYQTKEYRGGLVWYEPEYPNLLFAKDGEVYEFDGYQCLVIGGAYSVDKYYRLMKRIRWFANEQPSEEIKSYVESQLEVRDHKIDVIFSHTCPKKYEPVEVFLSGIDQSRVDKKTEEWLDTIEERTQYKKWYCGHFHTTKKIDKMQFMYEDIDILKIEEAKEEKGQ